MNIKKFSHDPRAMKALTGLSYQEFEDLVPTFGKSYRDIQRQLDEERKKITEEAGKKATEEQQYVIAQLKKQLSDATKAKDDLARKLEQGSQQTQGEVLELELEAMLKAEFSNDEIIPVPKGTNGADIIQRVIDRSGRLCGQIVWESKKTKAWSDGWIQKLKDDQRTIKADLAVIVSIILPEDVKGFAVRDGIWVCDIKLIVALATALRMNLESLTREKAMSVGKNEKMEVLYSYLTGVEFKQRVEAIMEAFTGMDEGLRKERMVYEKIWSEREKQLKKVLNHFALKREDSCKRTKVLFHSVDVILKSSSFVVSSC